MNYFGYPPEKFPITIEAFNPRTFEIVWTQTIEAPGAHGMALIMIPSLKKQLGYSVDVRLRFGDGTVEEGTPVQ